MTDDDPGRSAKGLVARPGFETLAAALRAGAIGAELDFDPDIRPAARHAADLRAVPSLRRAPAGPSAAVARPVATSFDGTPPRCRHAIAILHDVRRRDRLLDRIEDTAHGARWA